MNEKIKEIIADQLNIELDKVTEESNFKDDLGADSLDLFNMIMALEDEYGIEIPTEDLEEITTVGAVAKYLKDKGVEI
jgi:acyl carrier protein